MFYLNTNTKIFVAAIFAIIGILVMLGGLHICLLEEKDTVTLVMSIYLMIDGLAVAIASIIYEFIHVWDKEPQRKSLDELEEIDVEEVN